MRAYIHVVGRNDPTAKIGELFEKLPGDYRVYFFWYDADFTQVTCSVGNFSPDEITQNMSLLDTIGTGLVSTIPNATVLVRHDGGKLPAFKSEYSPQDAAA
ncbi:hypothetical protein KKD95_03135 [Patescibacteria group bacterium]|nr:hypothetical protein [Patescibacteria group bacterium]